MELLKLISYLSSLLLIILYLIFPKRNKDKKFRVIFLYAISSFLSDSLSILYPEESTDMFLYPLFTLVEFTVFSYFFYFTYKDRVLRRLVIGSFMLFGAIFIYTTIYRSKISFDSITSSVDGVFVIIFCILFFYEQLKTPEVTFVYASKSFWIAIGCLIYASTTLFLFTSFGNLEMSAPEQDKIWGVSAVANLIKNILFMIALYKPLTMHIDRSVRNEDKRQNRESNL